MFAEDSFLESCFSEGLFQEFFQEFFQGFDSILLVSKSPFFRKEAPLIMRFLRISYI